MSDRILVVDDDPDVGRILGVLFGQIGRECISVLSVNEAMEYLKTDSPSLILSDFFMGGTDGGEFYDRVEQEFPHMASRFILFSACTEAEGFQAFVKRTGCPWAERPYRKEQIKHLLGLLGLRSTLDETR